IQYVAASRFNPSRSGILDHPPSRVMTTLCRRRCTRDGRSKHVRARGRTALSGVNLRPLGPGGGSKRRSFREVAGFTVDDGIKSRKVLVNNDRRIFANKLKTIRISHRPDAGWNPESPGTARIARFAPVN